MSGGVGMEEKRIVRIPADIYEEIEKRLSEYGFDTVDEYVTFVLQELIYEEKGDEGPVFSEEEEEKIKKRLRDLGYIE